MNEQLIAKLKYLHLGGLLAHWDDYLKLAADQHWSDTRLLTHVIEEEYRLNRGRQHQRRLRNALLPEPWAIESYPFPRQPKLNQKKLMAVYDSLDYMRHSQNVIWLGRPGVGKTGLATSFLTHAIDQGHSGRYVLFPELLTQFYQSVADHSEAKVLKQYLSYDCLLIDELGYLEVEPVQVALFFTLLHRRHRKKPTLITSNLGFADWGSFLKNPHLTAALIDRLTENSHVFNMRECVSLRAPLHSEA
jgi:DNA replication protein DnaC